MWDLAAFLGDCDSPPPPPELLRPNLHFLRSKLSGLHLFPTLLLIDEHHSSLLMLLIQGLLLLFPISNRLLILSILRFPQFPILVPQILTFLNHDVYCRSIFE